MASDNSCTQSLKRFNSKVMEWRNKLIVAGYCWFCMLNESKLKRVTIDGMSLDNSQHL